MAKQFISFKLLYSPPSTPWTNRNKNVYNMYCTVPYHLRSDIFESEQILVSNSVFVENFPRFLEVFVPWTILYNSYRNDFFEIVFTCSIAFQRYQTWYGNNYLKLTNCWAGQKKAEFLFSLHRATSHDLEKAWSYICATSPIFSGPIIIIIHPKISGMLPTFRVNTGTLEKLGSVASGASLGGELLLGTGLPPDWLHGKMLTLLNTKPRKLKGPMTKTINKSW